MDHRYNDVFSVRVLRYDENYGNKKRPESKSFQSIRYI